MESTPPARFSSPLIQKNTPIKRLGLSRKRKSGGSDDSFVNKIQAFGNNSPLKQISVINSQTKEINTEAKPSVKNESQQVCDENSLSSDKVINEDEINSLKEKINEKESKLKSLKQNRDIESLENLTEIWKVGCKNAYLYMIQLLKEKHSGDIDTKTLLKRLGIFKTMSETFENDSEVSLSDSSQ